MNIFDIVGPIMVGPSSSHTAGACKIGNVFNRVYGSIPKEVYITFYGSFADTFLGHGTDKAIVGGLMGYKTFDKRIINSLETADEIGMKVYFIRSKQEMPHPNTVAISSKLNDRDITILAESIGGGNIIVREIDGIQVKLDGAANTIVISHHDEPGMINHVTSVLNEQNINIATMIVSRMEQYGTATMVIEIDEVPEKDLKDIILSHENVYGYRLIQKL